MWPVATDVVVCVSACLPACVSLCWARVSCAKTAEPIEMPFGGLTHVDPRNYMHIQNGNGALLRGGMRRSIVMYVHMTTLRVVDECIRHLDR